LTLALTLTLTPTLTPTDLKDMFTRAGVKQEGVLFLITDSQITDHNEKLFVYINDLLSQGYVSDLHSKDEREQIIKKLTIKAGKEGYTSGPLSVWQYFLDKVRQNLHCCLCFSPLGTGLRTRARKFPALANCTVIDWFQPWPDQALSSVASKMLSKAKVESEISKAIEVFLPSVFLEVNRMSKKFCKLESRHVYITPKNYLEMLVLFQTMLTKKREESDYHISRLENGVQKLKKASSDVAHLEANLKLMMMTFDEKRLIAEGLAKNVQSETAGVEAEKAKVHNPNRNPNRNP
jgi:dynein heavy chain